MNETIPSNLEPAIERRIHHPRSIGLLALAIILFLCGGAAGWGVAIICRRPPPMAMGLGPEAPLDGMVRQLRDELLLSDDQARQVRQIYQQRQDALQAIRQKMGPELKSEYDKLDEQMKGVLNSAQYRRWSERFRSVRNRMLPPPPPPGGPGPGPMPGPGGPEDRPDRGPPDGMPPP